MSAQKRETILVVLDLLGSGFPTLNGMALCAIGTHLTAVNVGVAIRAVFADVSEYRFDVALDAFYFFVHAAERILGFAVVEFGNGADRAPRRRSVTVFAGNTESAVGIASRLILGSRDCLC